MIWREKGAEAWVTDGYTVCRYRVRGIERFEAWRHVKGDKPTCFAKHVETEQEAKERCELDKLVQASLR